MVYMFRVLSKCPFLFSLSKSSYQITNYIVKEKNEQPDYRALIKVKLPRFDKKPQALIKKNPEAIFCRHAGFSF